MPTARTPTHRDGPRNCLVGGGSRDAAGSELRHSLSLVEAALESTADGILIVDRDNHIVRSNRRFVEMWRIPPEIVDGHDDAVAIAFVLDQLVDPGAFVKRVRELYDSPSETSFDTLCFRDGRVIERYSQPHRLGDAIVGRVWSFRDVTQRVRAEHERDRLFAEEKRAREAAEQAVRMRDEFLAIASHELRTPLTGLQLALDGLRTCTSSSGRLDPEQLERVLAVSKRQVRKLTALVGLLLDVARVGGGALELRRTEVDLGQLVLELSALLTDEQGRAGSAIEVRAEPGVIGHWDRARIEQVVTNLLGNAIKFGRGERVEVSVTRSDGGAVLVVRDHGIGIAPDMQPRLFTPFERGVSWTNYGGLGLGLFIARTIVQAHAGTIALESELEQGATFTVTLPLAGGAETPDPVMEPG